MTDLSTECIQDKDDEYEKWDEAEDDFGFGTVQVKVCHGYRGVHCRDPALERRVIFSPSVCQLTAVCKMSEK